MDQSHGHATFSCSIEQVASKGQALSQLLQQGDEAARSYAMLRLADRIISQCECQVGNLAQQSVSANCYLNSSTQGHTQRACTAESTFVLDEYVSHGQISRSC